MCNLCSASSSRLSRRGLILGSAALAGAAAISSHVAWAEAVAPQNAIGPDEALKRLMEGNARYAANTSANQDYSAGRAARVNAQYPVAAILSCADARVAPELAFDQAPGDLFVVRVAGNFVNEDGLASFEYAVKYLNTPLLMVLGHSNCGAVAATIKVLKDGVTLPGHLQDMIREIKPAVVTAKKAKPADLLAAAIEDNIRRAVHRLETATPILAEPVKSQKVKVVGAHYDLATGNIALV
ncbi:carbonic anhydrase [Mesorhizobium sp.]|uniref:carbonic anhydrase n=1 Tax=Mesorhizobium sp. TaxID=1871066 RepID=UPI000FE457E9|nr:carbonic anhydrase [Mesorhizobium sp.]RWL99948.1 MAG: carbonic anhydrase [Mesorhizobium sp.]